MTKDNVIRRMLMSYYTGSMSFTTAWVQGPVFDLMKGFQPYSKIKLYYHVPGRNDSGSWGGAYIELQMRLNEGSWVSLGSGGHDGNVMNINAYAIGSYNNTMLIDPKQTQEYSVQFRLVIRSYDGTYILNGSSDLGATSGTAPFYPDSNLIYQHYCHIIVEEVITE